MLWSSSHSEVRSITYLGTAAYVNVHIHDSCLKWCLLDFFEEKEQIWGQLPPSPAVAMFLT